jgi:uncharacterized protein (DUF2236 family)
VYASLAAYEQFVNRLSDPEREQYLVEMNLVARLFGVPANLLPPTYAAFREYFRSQLASDTITVAAPAREVASVILSTPIPASRYPFCTHTRCAFQRRREMNARGSRVTGHRDLLFARA